jgi:hypothetical protein
MQSQSRWANQGAAADWGRVWEVDRLSPKDMAADGRQITGDWLLRLEWLEASP